MTDDKLSVRELKQKLRQTMQIQRQLLDPSVKAQYDEAINVQLQELIISRDCHIVHTYLPMTNEVNILPVIDYLMSQNDEVICPRALSAGRLEHRRLKSLHQIKQGLFGTAYPAERAIYAGPYDLIIVPGLAFDQANNRLGYGGGYYDAFLSLHPEAYKVGVGYDFQRVPTVPVEEHDQHLDLVITNLFVK